MKTLIGRAGPFQIVEAHGVGNVDQPIEPPRRRYDCVNYECCLDLAAALNWDNFTCRGCTGEVDQTLYWRAHQAMKKDRLVKRICALPEIKQHSSEPLVIADPIALTSPSDINGDVGRRRLR